MLARSILFESSSKLLVTRIGIKTWSSSILGRIRPLILELLALEWRKFHTFELEYLWSQLANLDQILYVASLGWGERLHKVLGQIDLGTLDSGEWLLPFGLLVLKSLQWILFICGVTIEPCLQFYAAPSQSQCMTLKSRSQTLNCFVLNLYSVSSCKAFDWFESCLVWMDIRF